MLSNNAPGPQRLTRWETGHAVAIVLGELLERLAVRQGNGTLRLLLTREAPPAAELAALTPPTQTTLHAQLPLVIAYADLRADRFAEIQSQQVWPVDYWSAVLGITPRQHPNTLLLMAVVQSLAVHVVARMKHLANAPRPVQLSAQVQPMLATPMHAAWPGGHATESFAAAALLGALIKAARPELDAAPLQQQLNRLATRIATNRVVAGLHYPLDTAAGWALGTSLGDYVVACAAKGTSVNKRDFNSQAFGGKDFSVNGDLASKGTTETALALTAATEVAALQSLWDAAIKEWV
ncbi:phosphatase PAP2 family protein [Ottowia sp. SB7-C50]|uniref:phosphatase PAP2 family protein n=1 Tax=Ottowia sp. SB7-C50 TaxID=3081231 RepID=UPI002953F874|nr:phosphatase PAP2 family protein [Ottowia sp. SB7-C50]WOP15809.1 phosphatase PAP2 family protein [Ottowia sp. SB7-C50]